MCENLHKYSQTNNNLINIEDSQNSDLRYYHDKYNESLLLYVLKTQCTEFIKKYNYFLSIRPDEVIYEFTRDPRTEFIPNIGIHMSHIIILKAKSQIYEKNYRCREKWIYIDKLYNTLDKNKNYANILKIAAENKMMRINFIHVVNNLDIDFIKSTNTRSSFGYKYSYIPINLVSRDEINLEDDKTTVINTLCRIVASMLCLDNCTNDFLFDHIQKIHIGKLIYIYRILQSDKCIHFKELMPTMQTRILESVVDFQGVDVKFSDIINDLNTFTYLSSKLIRHILIRNINVPIKIGNGYKSDIIPKILKRKLVKCQSDVSEESGIPVLVGDFGTGKTSMLEFMSIKFKQESNTSWVVIIKLTNDILQQYLNKNICIDNMIVINLLSEIINPQSKLETDIFKHLFFNNKVILLIDDIDIIKIELADFFIKIINWITTNSKNKLWITTRPVFLKNIKKHLKIIVYKFDSNSLQELIPILFKNIRNDDNIPTELISFINCLENRNNIIYTITNCMMLQIIIEIYDKNELIFKENPVNIYLIFEKICIKQSAVFDKYIVNDLGITFNWFNISKVHQCHALKIIFDNNHDIQLTELAIIKNWKQEEYKWNNERIGWHGYISFDEIDNFKFTHYSYAEFFTAQYLISYIFSYDYYCISDKEFEKIFRIIRYISNKFDEYEIICKFIIGYCIKYSNVNELCETIRNIIFNNKDDIQKDITTSQNASDLKNFWLEIVKNDKELLDFFK